MGDVVILNWKDAVGSNRPPALGDDTLELVGKFDYMTDHARIANRNFERIARRLRDVENMLQRLDIPPER